MIVYNKALLRIGEVWFDEEVDTTPVDVVYYYYCRQPAGDMFYREFYTMCVDLNQDQDSLLGNMKKYTQYEIRRAASKDGLLYEYWGANCQEVLSQYIEFYDKFASQTALLPADRARLNLLASNGVLEISRVREPEGNPLVWHVFLRGKERVQLLSSPSLFRSSTDSNYRNLVGRANRYHHWQDMLRFKGAGLSTYGLGVWYAGNTNRTYLNINRFKEEFGGQVSKRFECKRAITPKGKLALHIQKLLKRNLNGSAKAFLLGYIITGNHFLEPLI